MASVEQIGNKLLKVLQENRKNNESHSSDEKRRCAIAIMGEWGIGKTHFWDIFQKYYLKDKGRKIAYVSLFGIESLSDLKYEIGIKTKSSEVSEKDDRKNLKVKNMLKGILNNIKIPDIESNGFVFSLSQNIVTSAIFGLVKDTIICIDDLERKSDKLDLKDVMGLVNQLKLEKNCQVIVILHEDKAGDKFQEYKEKVFDDVFYLTENFDIIKEIIDNDEIIHIYQDFYDKLQVKNLRFYERVNKYYNEIVSLVDDLTITSKEHILRNLLMVRFADQFPKKFKFENEQSNFVFNLDFISNFKMGDFTDTELTDRIDKLNDFFKGFIYFYGMDNWVKIVANNIVNHDIDTDLFLELVEQDKISEQKIKIKEQIDKLMIEWHNLDIKDNFANRFYDALIDFIDINKSVDLDNVFFHYEVINSQNADLANDFKKIVQDTIEFMLKRCNRKPSLYDFYHSNTREGDIFYDFLKDKIDNYDTITNNSNINDDFCNYFLSKFYDKPLLKDIDLNLMDKNILSKIIWVELEEVRYQNRKRFIQTILSYVSNQHREQVCQWVIELLNEKIQENPNSKGSIESWLLDTENLTKF